MAPRADGRPKGRPRALLWAALAALALLAALAGGAALDWGADAARLGEVAAALREQFADWLRQVPRWLFVVTFVTLPAFGVPLSIYYLSVGAVFGTLGLALGVAILCMAANMALSYAVAAAFTGPIRRVLAHRGYRVPQLRGRRQWKVVVALRASPLPWLMQSWLLTLGGTRFSTYMLFGVPVQSMVAIALVITGDALLAGRPGWLLLGLLAVILVYSALRWRAGQRELDPSQGQGTQRD